MTDSITTVLDKKGQSWRVEKQLIEGEFTVPMGKETGVVRTYSYTQVKFERIKEEGNESEAR